MNKQNDTFMQSQEVDGTSGENSNLLWGYSPDFAA